MGSNARFWMLMACFLIVAVLAAFHGHDKLRCQEDEIIAWDGDRHTVCVNLDEVDAYYGRVSTMT